MTIFRIFKTYKWLVYQFDTPECKCGSRSRCRCTWRSWAEERKESRWSSATLVSPWYMKARMARRSGADTPRRYSRGCGWGCPREVDTEVEVVWVAHLLTPS